MVTKRVSERTRPTKRTEATPSAELAASAALVVLESTDATSPVSANIDSDLRRRLVATEAYFRAVERGFQAGHELEDWLAAELSLDEQLQQMRTA